MTLQPLPSGFPCTWGFFSLLSVQRLLLTLNLYYDVGSCKRLNPDFCFKKSWLSFTAGFKWTDPQDFRLLVFFINQFPPRPWVYHKSRFKVVWQFTEIFSAQGSPPVSLTPVANEKIFSQKNLVGTPLNSRVNMYINFCLQVHLRYLQPAAWYCSLVCHRSWTPVAIFNFNSTKGNWWQNFPPVLLIPVAICHRCRWYRWCTLTCEYLRKFSKKFETVLLGYSGAGGKLIHEKNQRQKSRDCPFSCFVQLVPKRSVSTSKLDDTILSSKDLLL